MKFVTFNLTKSNCLAFLAFVVLAMPSLSYADTVFYDAAITNTDPTSHVTGQSTVGSGMQYYDVYTLTVSVSGTYTLELSSRNTSGTPSNALDTWMAVFANVFNPVAPGSPQISNDDFTGTLTVLPGPYTAQGYTATATGFTGAQPSSRFNTTLNAGTTYFLYVSSFRDTTYSSPTTSNGNPTGPYVGGITGPGTITLVPEPSTLALLGLGLAGLGFMARRKAGRR